MFTQIHPGPIFWMAKLVNHLQGGMSGTQKKFSLLVKRKLYEEEFEITLNLCVSEGFEIRFVVACGYANQ